jgi:hypothetical protein
MKLSLARLKKWNPVRVGILAGLGLGVVIFLSHRNNPKLASFLLCAALCLARAIPSLGNPVGTVVRALQHVVYCRVVGLFHLFCHPWRAGWSFISMVALAISEIERP